MKQIVEWVYDHYDACWIWRSSPFTGFPYEFKVKIRVNALDNTYYYATFYQGRYLKRQSKFYSTQRECMDAATIHIHRVTKIVLEEDIPNHA